MLHEEINQALRSRTSCGQQRTIAVGKSQCLLFDFLEFHRANIQTSARLRNCVSGCTGCGQAPIRCAAGLAILFSDFFPRPVVRVEDLLALRLIGKAALFLL